MFALSYTRHTTNHPSLQRRHHTNHAHIAIQNAKCHIYMPSHKHIMRFTLHLTVSFVCRKVTKDETLSPEYTIRRVVFACCIFPYPQTHAHLLCVLCACDLLSYIYRQTRRMRVSVRLQLSWKNERKNLETYN